MLSAPITRELEGRALGCGVLSLKLFRVRKARLEDVDPSSESSAAAKSEESMRFRSLSWLAWLSRPSLSCLNLETREVNAAMAVKDKCGDKKNKENEKKKERKE